MEAFPSFDVDFGSFGEDDARAPSTNVEPDKLPDARDFFATPLITLESSNVDEGVSLLRVLIVQVQNSLLLLTVRLYQFSTKRFLAL